jgi:hypothetical protein
VYVHLIVCTITHKAGTLQLIGKEQRGVDTTIIGIRRTHQIVTQIEIAEHL